jgi:hypothetical protein
LLMSLKVGKHMFIHIHRSRFISTLGKKSEVLPVNLSFLPWL